MKHLLIIPFCLLLIAGVKYKNRLFRPKDSSASATIANIPQDYDKSDAAQFFITSLGVDTSSVLALHSDDISLNILLNDTSSAGDSAQIKVVILASISSGFPTSISRDFVRMDSITVSTEIATHKVYLTPNSTTLPRAPDYIVELTGLADNKKLSAVSAQVTANYISK